MAGKVTRDRRFFRPLAVAIASCLALQAQVNPTGPAVASGSAAVKQAGNLLQIDNLPSAINNLLSYSIGPGEITKFVRQSSLSAVLNRVQEL